MATKKQPDKMVIKTETPREIPGVGVFYPDKPVEYNEKLFKTGLFKKVKGEDK